MKLILLIAFVLIFSIASSKLIKVQKNLARTIAPESLALELEFFGSCQEFEARVIPSIWISRHAGCLPINTVTLNPDFDDLRSHYFCTPVGNGRSVIHFVEIYENEGAENTPYLGFVLSLIPSNPFRVLTENTFVNRRPDCFVTQDYCNGTNAIVNSCKSNAVVYREFDNEHRDGNRGGDRDSYRGGDKDGHRDGGRHKRGEVVRGGDRDSYRGGDRDGHKDGDRHNRRSTRYIVSHDRIYITANQLVSLDCKTTGTTPVCCAYIAPENQGGICDHNGSNDLLDFPKNRHNNNNNHYDNDNHNDLHNNDHQNPNDGGHWQHSNGQPNVQGSWESHHDFDKKAVKQQ